MGAYLTEWWQAFWIGAMASWTPAMVIFALLLIKAGRRKDGQ